MITSHTNWQHGKVFSPKNTTTLPLINSMVCCSHFPPSNSPKFFRRNSNLCAASEWNRRLRWERSPENKDCHVRCMVCGVVPDVLPEINKIKSNTDKNSKRSQSTLVLFFNGIDWLMRTLSIWRQIKPDKTYHTSYRVVSCQFRKTKFQNFVREERGLQETEKKQFPGFVFWYQATNFFYLLSDPCWSNSGQKSMWWIDVAFSTLPAVSIYKGSPQWLNLAWIR